MAEKKEKVEKKEEVEETKKVEDKKEEETVSKGNTKIYKILAYFGILWIVGLLVQEKDDKSVRFHVGQGMLITILGVIIALINNLLVANIFVVTKTGYWGLVEYQTTSGLGMFIMIILWIIPTVLAIIGIINAAKDQDKELPVIGKLAFYK